MKVIIVALIALTLVPEALSQCDESFSFNVDTSITVSAPQYPNRYRFGPFCTYTIEAPAGTVFTATCDLEIFFDAANGVCYITQEFPHFIFFPENGVGFCGTGTVTQIVTGDTMTIQFFRPQSRGSTPRSLIREWRRSGLNGFTCEIDVDVPDTTTPPIPDTTTPPVPDTTTPPVPDTTTPPPTCCQTACGVATTVEKRIINGQNVVQGSYPWIVSLIIDNQSLCTASIIGCNVILTAAHCIDDASSVRVAVGDHNLRADEPFDQIFTATRFAFHPDYNPAQISNDIGLIFLDQDIPFGGTDPQANPICLPNSPVVDGMAVTAAGWGRVLGGSIPSILQEVPQTLYTTAFCSSFSSFFNHPSKICTVDAGTGICSGDSGGALFSTGGGVATVVGVNSFGFTDGSADGCNENAPSGYSDVFNQIDWIRTTAAVNGGVLCS